MIVIGSRIILVVLLVAAIMGWRKGFIAQVGALAGLILGIVAARMFGPAAIAMFPPVDVAESLPRHYLQLSLVYGAIYLAVYFGVMLVVKLLRFVVKTLCLGPLDSLGGAAIGVLKWAIPLSMLLDIVAMLWPDSELVAQHHPVIEAVQGFAPWLLGLLSLSTPLQ